MKLHSFLFGFMFCACVVAGEYARCDQPPVETSEADPGLEWLQKLHQRDLSIENLKGREIFGTVVSEIVYLGRLDVRHLYDAELGARLSLHRVHEVDALGNLAEFQPNSVDDGGKVSFSFEPKEEDVGSLFVAAFNYKPFGKFAYRKRKQIGHGEAEVYATVRGIGTDISHTPFPFRVASTASVTFSFEPETADRWWFGSCDLYLLR